MEPGAGLRLEVELAAAIRHAANEARAEGHLDIADALEDILTFLQTGAPGSR
jgi:hypothetical protein